MTKQEINRVSLKQLGWPLALVLAVFLGGLLVLVPKVKEIFFLRGENKQQRDKLEKLNIKAEILENLSVSNLSKKLELTFKVLPIETDPLLFLFTMEQTATQHSLKLRQFSLGESSAAKDSFNCSLEGSNDNFKPFFVELDKVLPLMAVGDIKVRDLEGNLEVDFSLQSYSLAVEEKIKPSEEVNLLSEKEEKILEDLGQFSSVAGSSFLESVPSEDSGRSNPFFF